MRCAVAALALRDHLVFCLVTGGTGQFRVLELAGAQQGVSCFVAAGAVLGWCLVTVGDVLRHVGLVTLLAVGGGLLGKVRLVALGAVRDLAVDIVAGAAVQRSVLALVVAQLDDLAGVAGYAGVGDVIAELDVQRCMRIRVTTQAAGQLEVRLAVMALAAERDDLAVRGRMAVVAVLAADLGLVFVACRSDICRSLAVTFDAVGIEQFGWSR